MNNFNLNQIDLFSSFSNEDILYLKTISHIKKFQNDDILFYEGDDSDNLYFLIEGKVEVYKTNRKGKKIVLTQFSSLSFIAEASHYANIKFPATAKSINNSVVLIIAYDKFEKRFLHYSQISLFIIKSLASKIVCLEKTFSNNLIMDAQERIAKYLYENEGCLNCLKHHEIAESLNITPVTFSRILKIFKVEKIIQKNKVINKKRLYKLFS
jgi:CRP/FNR family transcriptional regulator